MTPSGRTIAEKIWDMHTVCDVGGRASLLQVDRVFLHERAGGFIARALHEKGRRVLNPELVAATMDHIIDTDPGRSDETKFPGGTSFIQKLRAFTHDQSIRLFDIGDPRQGIAHLVAAEQAFALPGATFVCADSHTCTLGGLGLLAWGIGFSEMEHVLATQCIRQGRARQMRVTLEGVLPADVAAKDIVLNLIASHGATGGDGHVIEFSGPAARALPIEARMTICNMAVEFGAWTAIFAPDEITFDFFRGRPFAPKGEGWERAEKDWRLLVSDPDATFDTEIVLDCARLAPTVTWGTSPQHAVAVDSVVPDPAAVRDPVTRESMMKALDYMDLRPGTALRDVEVDAAFIGSCTNGRISDLRAAGSVLKGRHVAQGMIALCVPGSSQVKQQAEAEGLDIVFREAGFEWREAGCSLCFFAGGDSFGSAQRIISSTNRNFEGRQGPGVRTHLASPATVAASAITGRITDPRQVHELEAR